MSMEKKNICVSGRYPWGEGVEAFPNALAFAEKVKALKSQGIPDEDVLKIVNSLLQEDRRMKPTGFRMATRTAFHERKREQLAEICHLYDEGYSWHDISCRMELSESTVKHMYTNRLTEKELSNKQLILLDALKSQAEQCEMVVIPEGKCGKHGIPECRLYESIYRLEAEFGFGRFSAHYHRRNVFVLVKPGITREYVLAHEDKIKPFIWPEDLDRAAES